MNMKKFKVTYNVDMVFCIDATGSMGSVIDMVKDNALHLYEDVMESMALKGKTIDSLRVKLIAFRDYIADAENAMLASQFFSLPEEILPFNMIILGYPAKEKGFEDRYKPERVHIEKW